MTLRTAGQSATNVPLSQSAVNRPGIETAKFSHRACETPAHGKNQPFFSSLLDTGAESLCLKDKNVVVSGESGGLGLGLVEALVAQGCQGNRDAWTGSKQSLVGLALTRGSGEPAIAGIGGFGGFGDARVQLDPRSDRGGANRHLAANQP